MVASDPEFCGTLVPSHCCPVKEKLSKSTRVITFRNDKSERAQEAVGGS